MKHAAVAQATLILCACLGFAPAQAQQKPLSSSGKPIRVLTTVTAGGGLDIITRAVTSRIAESLGQPLIVDNLAGANGLIAMNALLAADSDGHTILSGGGSIPINSVFKRFTVDVRQALAPIGQMSFQPYMVFVPAASPFKSFPELIANARQNPGKLNYGSSGIGSVIHMGSELIEYLAGVDMVHVPYKGAAASNVDLAAGRLNMLLGSISGLQLVRTGKARILAVTTTERMEAYPDVPTVAEFLPGYELSNSYVLYVRAETPATTVSSLNKEVIKALSDPALRKQMLADSSNPAPPRTPAELKKMLATEIERWESVVKKANISLDK
jgi:tripartite-type tricarboxylate transporter receptor subunit TctC